MVKNICWSLLFCLAISADIHSESNAYKGQTDKPSATTARVKFIIRVPYKLGMISTAKKTLFNSNTDNLLVTNQQTNNSTFISQTSPIQLQHSQQGQYTVASP